MHLHIIRLPVRVEDCSNAEKIYVVVVVVVVV